MANMGYRCLLPCLLLIGVWSCTGEGRNVGGPGHLADPLYTSMNVPNRCYTHTITPVSCSGVGQDRLMPHPDDCRLFYQCALDWAICRECPADLHFNPVKHVCDRPESAGCALTSSAGTTSTSSAGTTSTSSTGTTSTSTTTRNPLTTLVTLH